VTERGRSFPYPDAVQAIAFHEALMQRLGITDLDVPDEAKVRSSLERAAGTVQHQRGDIVTLASFLLFGLIRDKPFGKGSTQTGLALTLAVLLRNGVAVVAPEEEIAGVGLGIASGEVYAGIVEMWLRDSARPAW
jgi:prophage maintenance system killer protein